MDVTCDKCRTEYEFDDSLISESGTTVKCTNCGHLFRIYKPGTPEAKKKPAWMLRQPDGSVYTFERMTTLQRWIAEGKVSREDTVSRTGEGWQTLGSMKELAPFFESAAVALEEQDEEDAWGDDGPTIRRPPASQSSSIDRPPAVAPRPPKPQPPKPPPRMPPISRAPGPHPLGPATATPHGVPPIRQPAPPASPSPAESPSAADAAQPEQESPAKDNSNWAQGQLLESSSPAWTSDKSDGPTEKPESQEPAWAEERISTLPQEPKEDEEAPRQSNKMLKVGVPLLLVGLVAVGIAGLYFFKPNLFHQLASQVITESAPSSSSETYLRGREYFLLDTTEGFRQADREYHRSKANDGLSRAGLAEVYTTWSQYYLDEVADYRLKAEKANPAEASALAARADVKNEEFQQKLEQARRFVDAALKQAQGTVEAHRAAADYYRLIGDMSKARQHISRALQLGRDHDEALPETQYVEALVDLTDDHDTATAIQRLDAINSNNSKLIRCHYRLARLRAATGDLNGARTSLEAALALNKEHVLSREMLESLIRSEPPLVAVTSATIETIGVSGDLDGGIASDASADGAADAMIATAEPDAGPAPEPDAEVPEATEVSAPGEGVESFDAIVSRATKAQSNGSPEACSLFRRADRIRGGHPEVLVGLGYCAADQGNRSRSMDLYRRALSSSGSYGPALMALASGYRSQGNNQRALEYYRRYLQAHPSGSQAGIARRNIDRLEELLEEPEPTPPAPSPEPTAQPDSEPETPPSEAVPPPAETPPSTEDENSQAGTPDAPSVIRVTQERQPEVHSDSLATDSEPPLRPGEDIE